METQTLLELGKWLSGLIVFLISLFYTIRHFKVIRSVSYIERLNNPSMIKVRESVDSWANSSKSNEDKIKDLEDDSQLSMNVRVLYSVFTEIGIAYRRRIVSRKIICDTYNPIVPEYWQKLEFYILDQRNKGHKIGYSFKKLNNEILKYQNKNWKGRSKLFDDEIDILEEIKVGELKN